MRMPSKFNGKCATCGIEFPKGFLIDYRDEKAHCASHSPESPAAEPERNGAGSHVALAERLGYAAANRLDSDWQMLILSWRNRKFPPESDGSDNAPLRDEGRSEDRGPTLPGL